jgi:hypothetical protein
VVRILGYLQRGAVVREQAGRARLMEDLLEGLVLLGLLELALVLHRPHELHLADVLRGLGFERGGVGRSAQGLLGLLRVHRRLERSQLGQAGVLGAQLRSVMT